jgi:hypothetical protein
LEVVVEAKRDVVVVDEYLYPAFPRGQNVAAGDVSHPATVKNSVQRRCLWRRSLMGTLQCPVIVVVIVIVCFVGRRLSMTLQESQRVQFCEFCVEKSRGPSFCCAKAHVAHSAGILDTRYAGKSNAHGRVLRRVRRPRIDDLM